jgi:putative endonuclease
MGKQAFVYILTNKLHTVFYVGVTSNLVKRAWEHRSDLVERFTRRYRVHKLVYYEAFESIEEAISREKFIKGKSREYKVSLVESINSEWEDLWERIR